MSKNYCVIVTSSHFLAYKLLLFASILIFFDVFKVICLFFPKDEETGLLETPPSSDQEEKNIQSKEKLKCKRHKGPPNIRFNIKGSATLTNTNLFSSECEDTLVTENLNEESFKVAETNKENATEVGISADSSTNLPETLFFNDGKTYMHLDFTDNKGGESDLESNVQMDIVENDSWEDEEFRKMSSIGAGESNDNEEVTRVSENETTVKEPDKFGDRKSYEAVHNSELSKKTSEVRSSNDHCSSEDSQHEVDYKISPVIELIPNGSETRIKEISPTNIRSNKSKCLTCSQLN